MGESWKEKVWFTCPKCYAKNKYIKMSYKDIETGSIYKLGYTGERNDEFSLLNFDNDEPQDVKIIFSQLVDDEALYYAGRNSKTGKPMVVICSHCQSDIPEDIFDRSYNTIVIAGSKGVGKTELFTLMTNDFQIFGHKYFENTSVTFLEDTDERLRRKNQIEDLKQYGSLQGTAMNEKNSILLKLQRVKNTDIYALYDAAGEKFDDYNVDTLSTHLYFGEATGILLLVDVLQLNGVKQRVDPKKRSQFIAAEAQDISNIVSNLTQLIRSTRGLKNNENISIPLAVVLTKIDAVIETFPDVFNDDFEKLSWSKDNHNERIKQISQITKNFLVNEIGEYSFVNQLEQSYSTINFFSVASRGLEFQQGEDIEPFLVELPFIWLMERNKTKGIFSKFTKWLGGN